MILSIDIGNTNIVIGCGENGKLILLKGYLHSTTEQHLNLQFCLKIFLKYIM